MRYLDQKGICTRLGERLAEHKVHGHVSVDLVVFSASDVHQYQFSQEEGVKKGDLSATQLENDMDLSLTQFEQGGQQLFWAVDLDVYMNDYTSNFYFFNFLMQGHLLKDSSYEVSVELKKDKRFFMVVPFIFHTALREFSFQQFFTLCRQEGIAYDFKSKTGSTFILVDDFKRQVVGIMAIATSHNECAR